MALNEHAPFSSKSADISFSMKAPNFIIRIPILYPEDLVAFVYSFPSSVKELLIIK